MVLLLVIEVINLVEKNQSSVLLLNPLFQIHHCSHHLHKVALELHDYVSLMESNPHEPGQVSEEVHLHLEKNDVASLTIFLQTLI